eukprot:10082756-Alexandrium_andersonii.AAC.1
MGRRAQLGGRLRWQRVRSSALEGNHSFEAWRESTFGRSRALTGRLVLRSLATQCESLTGCRAVGRIVLSAY